MRLTGSLLISFLLAWTGMAGLANAKISRAGGGGRPSVGGTSRGGAAAKQRPSGGAAAAQRPSGGAAAAQRPSGGAAAAQRPSGGAAAAQRPSGGAAAVQRPSGVQERTRTSEFRGELNRNVDINRDIDVDVDHHWGWGWGSFATGTAVGVATGAAISAATSHEPGVVVVAPPPTGTYISTLPVGCTAVASGTTTVYNCNGAYFQPFFDGTNVVYQAVPGP